MGYARISTSQQTLTAQVRALRRAGCDPVYSDTISGARRTRDGLQRCLADLAQGDVLVVTRADRLARTVFVGARALEDLDGRGVVVESLAEGVDSRTPEGQLRILQAMLSGQAERLRNLESTRTGLRNAVERGAVLGRPTAMTAEQTRHARALREAGYSARAVAESMGVSRSALYRALDRHPEECDPRQTRMGEA